MWRSSYPPKRLLSGSIGLSSTRKENRASRFAEGCLGHARSVRA
jgi:hypothetical protein